LIEFEVIYDLESQSEPLKDLSSYHNSFPAVVNSRIFAAEYSLEIKPKEPSQNFGMALTYF